MEKVLDQNKVSNAQLVTMFNKCADAQSPRSKLRSIFDGLALRAHPRTRRRQLRSGMSQRPEEDTDEDTDDEDIGFARARWHSYAATRPVSAASPARSPSELPPPPAGMRVPSKIMAPPALPPLPASAQLGPPQELVRAGAPPAPELLTATVNPQRRGSAKERVKELVRTTFGGKYIRKKKKTNKKPRKMKQITKVFRKRKYSSRKHSKKHSKKHRTTKIRRRKTRI